MEGVIYLLEKRVNIQTVQVFLELPSHLCGKTLQVKLKSNALYFELENLEPLTIGLDNIQLQQKVISEVVIDPSNYRFDGQTLEWKLPFFAQNNESSTKEELITPNQLRQIFCKFCGVAIVGTLKQQSIPFQKVLSMPSPYWLELSDLWICGCSNNSFQQFELGEIKSIQNTCLVGETFLLVHKNDVHMDILQIKKDKLFHTTTKKDHESLWAFVSCNRCLSTLGTCQVLQSEGFLELQGSLKLLKHKISSQEDFRSHQNLFKNNAVETLCAAEMLATSKTHQCFKFFILGQESGIVRLQILITNWNTSVNTNIFGNHATQKMIPVLQVLYVDCTENNEETEKFILKWKNKVDVEILTLLDEECAELLSTLNISNRAYPPQRRIFNDMKIGFLRMNSVLQ